MVYLHSSDTKPKSDVPAMKQSKKNMLEHKKYSIKNNNKKKRKIL